MEVVFGSGYIQVEGRDMGCIHAMLHVPGRVACGFVQKALICRVQGASSVVLCDVEWSGADKTEA